MSLPNAVWLSLGLLGGSTVLDEHLGDYQWNVTPRSSWGAQVLAGLGPFATGVRGAQTRTTQVIGIPDPASAAAVHATSVEWVAQARFAKVFGCDLLASGSGGRLHLGYHPDRVQVQPGGAGSAITVELSPVNSWIAGAGLGIRRPLAGPWIGSLGVERRTFSMETAHRNGGAIVMERERFGDWNARLELAWRFGRA